MHGWGCGESLLFIPQQSDTGSYMFAYRWGACMWGMGRHGKVRVLACVGGLLTCLRKVVAVK
eukprot:219398-Chlamydomonas_euryale.AAC.2